MKITEFAEGIALLPTQPELVCCRCYDTTNKLYPAKCHEKPEKMQLVPLGMYHCPDCGAMVLAGIPHPDLCENCVNKQHPDLD